MGGLERIMAATATYKGMVRRLSIATTNGMHQRIVFQRRMFTNIHNAVMVTESNVDVESMVQIDDEELVNDKQEMNIEEMVNYAADFEEYEADQMDEYAMYQPNWDSYEFPYGCAGKYVWKML